MAIRDDAGSRASHQRVLHVSRHAIEPMREQRESGRVEFGHQIEVASVFKLAKPSLLLNSLRAISKVLISLL